MNMGVFFKLYIYWHHVPKFTSNVNWQNKKSPFHKIILTPFDFMELILAVHVISYTVCYVNSNFISDCSICGLYSRMVPQILYMVLYLPYM